MAYMIKEKTLEETRQTLNIEKISSLRIKRRLERRMPKHLSEAGAFHMMSQNYLFMYDYPEYENVSFPQILRYLPF